MGPHLGEWDALKNFVKKKAVSVVFILETIHHILYIILNKST